MIINWTNVTSDAGFGVFGSNAALAKKIIQQAITDWENVIVSFNGKFPSFPNDQADIKVFIQQGNSLLSDGGFFDASRGNPLPDGSSGFGIVLGFNRNQPPTGGWFLSPDPASNSDFHPDVRDPQFAGTLPTNQGSDLLSSALHEIGHILGALTIDPQSPMLSNTGAFVPDAAGTLVPLFLFHFPNGVTVPLMEPAFTVGPNGVREPTGVGHLFFGTVQTPLAGTVTGRLDVMNQTGQANERTLISDFDAFILQDALGFSVNVPSQLGFTIGNRAPQLQHVVEIRNDGFHPQSLTIELGGTVRWINRDTITHTVHLVSATPGRPDSETAPIPPGQSVEIGFSASHSYFEAENPNLKGMISVQP
jgi:plastocyanin